MSVWVWEEKINGQWYPYHDRMEGGSGLIVHSTERYIKQPEPHEPQYGHFRWAKYDLAIAEGQQSSTLVEKAVQPAGERVSPEFIAGRLFEAKLIVENYLDLGGWELVSKDDFGEHIDYLERAALAAPTSTGESHDKPQSGQQHD